VDQTDVHVAEAHDVVAGFKFGNANRFIDEKKSRPLPRTAQSRSFKKKPGSCTAVTLFAAIRDLTGSRRAADSL
ncbi:MAG TPA: hypothetical protein VGD13_09395, partial [Xanthobacteraceae bacterium]